MPSSSEPKAKTTPSKITMNPQTGLPDTPPPTKPPLVYNLAHGNTYPYTEILKLSAYELSQAKLTSISTQVHNTWKDEEFPFFWRVTQFGIGLRQRRPDLTTPHLPDDVIQRIERKMTNTLVPFPNQRPTPRPLDYKIELDTEHNPHFDDFHIDFNLTDASTWWPLVWKRNVVLPVTYKRIVDASMLIKFREWKSTSNLTELIIKNRAESIMQEYYFEIQQSDLIGDYPPKALPN